MHIGFITTVGLTSFLLGTQTPCVTDTGLSYSAFVSSCEGTQVFGTLKPKGTTRDETDIEEVQKEIISEELKNIFPEEPVEIDYELYDPTNEEYNLMVRCVMSEGGLLPYEGKVAIAESIVNRAINNDDYPDNVKDVILKTGYSIADNGEPSEECYQAVDSALSQQSFDEQIMFFRTGHYHDFANDYIKIGNTYFSTK